MAYEDILGATRMDAKSICEAFLRLLRCRVQLLPFASMQLLVPVLGDTVQSPNIKVRMQEDVWGS